jgi:hypothetical protein
MAARIAVNVTKAARQTGGGVVGISHARIASDEVRPGAIASGSFVFMVLQANMRLAKSMDTLT